ncbi:ubiquinone biosynthesis protein UbiH [Tardibacter chloracetimidivorans]|uniref:Ubiquinone biosynthesis protein UbiH n=1 Tax=Tardibacter chloracetimidivorans TaxID=1921510 RepID=A0A1L3ZXE3_9SPHN|nr:FAD-dependent monooxygenase [Tardibacter chloracetimidivorans]API60280.1 ubiquinone biosynthesis protein UbiH [Tardibacter chloracetimidivorans]
MEQADVIILGGGLVGLTLALALDAHGLSSHVIDTADLKNSVAPSFDGRVSAISSSSMKMMDAIGIGARLRPHGCPIARISVTEGLSHSALLFDSTEGGAGDPLGHMVENRLLRLALLDAVAGAGNVKLNAPARAVRLDRGPTRVEVELDSGRLLRAPLVIVAEGRNSPTRQAAGIKVAQWRYDHGAVVTVIDHAKPHGNTAHEMFYQTGPFAILPMNGPDGSGTRSAIVWTVARDLAPAGCALPARALAAEIEKRMGGLLGEVRMAAPAWSYPLGFHHAARIVTDRLALVGDAAHGIHPIAGQGLNLGFRDVAALTEVLADGARLGLDLGDPHLLARYQRWRGLDTMMVAGMTDVLTRLFGLPGRTMRTVRAIGLAAVDRLPPLKRRFMAEARGETGELPKLLTGELA